MLISCWHAGLIEYVGQRIYLTEEGSCKTVETIIEKYSNKIKKTKNSKKEKEYRAEIVSIYNSVNIQMAGSGKEKEIGPYPAQSEVHPPCACRWAKFLAGD